MPLFDRDEYLAECSVITGVLRAKYNEDAKKGIWKTKDGTRIAVKDMKDSHLLNAYRYLEQNNVMDMYLGWLIVMQSEIRKRGLKYDFQENYF